MGLRHDVSFLVARGFDETGRMVVERLQDLFFVIHHVEDLRDEQGRRVVIIFGASNPVTGSTLPSLVLDGARYVPFIVKMTATEPKETETFVLAGGSENLIPTSYGRNQGVAEAILDGLPGRLLPSPSQKTPPSSSR